MNFKELGLNEQLIESISYMGFDQATPIQERAIPQILNGIDLIACAQTGTGKTAAFILPVIHQLLEGERNHIISTVVIVPTRELAIQIDQQIQGFSLQISLLLPSMAVEMAIIGKNRKKPSPMVSTLL